MAGVSGARSLQKPDWRGQTFAPWENSQNKETTKRKMQICFKPIPSKSYALLRGNPSYYVGMNPFRPSVPSLHTHTHTGTHAFYLLRSGGHSPQIYCLLHFHCYILLHMWIDHTICLFSTWWAFRLFWSFVKIAMGILLYQHKRFSEIHLRVTRVKCDMSPFF